MKSNLTKNTFQDQFLSIAWTGRLLIILALLFFTLNSIKLGQHLLEMQSTRKKVPYIFLGVKFLGLKDLVGQSRYLGYYSDKDMDVNIHSRQFSQAQYVLAPIILDLNNTQHEYIIFDCSTKETALAKIMEIGAIPLRENLFKIILARNPQIP